MMLITLIVFDLMVSELSVLEFTHTYSLCSNVHILKFRTVLDVSL